MLPVPVRCLIQFRVALLRDRSSPVRVFLPGKPARENPRPILGPILPFYSATIRRLKSGQFRCIRARNIPGSSATWGPWRRLRRQSIAIEIKLWQADGTGQNPWSDVKRLQSHSLERKSSGHLFTGITILFVHRGARNEQKLNNITGNKPERSRFPERRCYIPFGYFNGMEQGFDLILERSIGAN